MLHVVALLCALSLSPSECNQTNAVDVIKFGVAPNELVCMRDSMATLASLAIRADGQHRWVVKCVPPTSIGKDTVG